MSDNRTLTLYKKMQKVPLGNWLFSRAVCAKAPYFGSVKPLVKSLKPGYCEIYLKKRKIVENHIETVHIIAICNVLEMAMGIMAEASIPKHLRWIPKGMSVTYPAKGDTDIIGYAELDQTQWEQGPDVPVRVCAKNTRGEHVVEGTIHLWVTEKKPVSFADPRQ